MSFYRTGAFASLVSIASFAVMAWAAARLVLAMTGSALGAVTAAALLIANPNLLYLQSTPMTEPLHARDRVCRRACGCMSGSQAFRGYGQDAGHGASDSDSTRVALFAAAWTRYEAWLIIAAAAAGAALYALHVVDWRCDRVAGAARASCRLASGGSGAVRRSTAGSRPVGGSSPAASTRSTRRTTALPLKSLIAVWWGTHRLSGYVVESVALVAAGWLDRSRAGAPIDRRQPHSARAVRRRGPSVLRVCRRASVSRSLHGACLMAPARSCRGLAVGLAATPDCRVRARGAVLVGGGGRSNRRRGACGRR